MQIVHSEPIFCRVRVYFFHKIVCNFCLQSYDNGMREIFYLSCRGSYKAQEESFLSFRRRGCRGLPEKTFEKWCILSPFSAEFAWDGWVRKPVKHTSWVAVVSQTDRPKSVHNRCVIELFCGVVCVVPLPF